MKDSEAPGNYAPFGSPDGSRESISQVQSSFISFGGSSVWDGLATKSDDLSVRVIVGRKGSGKTVYLRCLQAHASDQPDLYAEPFQQNLPTTENVVKFCEFFDESILTEKWMSLWHKAILRSIVSHLLHNNKLSEHLEQRMIDIIKDKFFVILRDFGCPLTIYSQVSEIINLHNTGNQLTKYLENPLWNELENMIAEVLKTCPPICFYIDAVDEEFAHAPMYWHRCQKGLFYQTMRLLRDPKLGGRLHIVICIRDIVMSSVFRSEHSTRYHKEPHIRVLNWDKDAIKYFFKEKVMQLDSSYFSSDFEKAGKTIESWLGAQSIYNKIRETPENLEDYLIRHTRLLPRDIVLLGNELCRDIEKAKLLNRGIPLEEVIRQTVAKVARFFGNEQLAICGNHIASNTMPPNAAQHGYSSVYIGNYRGNKEYKEMVADQLKLLIQCIGKDIFSYDELRTAYSFSNELFGRETDPFSVLWQNGLLGYCKEYDHRKITVFYSENKMDEFKLPHGHPEYVFHSCLIDTIGLLPIGKKPITF